MFTLGRWSALGYTGGITASEHNRTFTIPSHSLISHPATGLYALAFGILGLLPVPRVRNAHDQTAPREVPSS